MGLFSFLTGGKKKEAKAAPVVAAPPPSRPTIVETKAEAALALALASAPIVPVAIAPVKLTAATGVTQAKLRLKLAASLRARQHMAAYEAARGLADIQVKAGRPNVARLWLVQADRLKAQLAA